ncbi:MAG: ABC-type transport auxiliary lipoprotein family protein [Rhizobiaceae bacterium]
MKTASTLMALMTAAALASGCAVLGGGGSKPLDTYELTAPSPTTSGRRLSRRQAIVTEPSALKALDSENIVVRASATSLEYLDGAQWADRLPKIIQARLVETFERSGRIGGIGKPGEGLAIDYQIIAEVRSFEIRLEGGERAQVEIAVKLLNDRNGVVRSTAEFSASSPVNGAGNDEFVAALDRAFAEVAVAIVDWALRRM